MMTPPDRHQYVLKFDQEALLQKQPGNKTSLHPPK